MHRVRFVLSVLGVYGSGFKRHLGLRLSLFSAHNSDTPGETCVRRSTERADLGLTTPGIRFFRIYRPKLYLLYQLYLTHIYVYTFSYVLYYLIFPTYRRLCTYMNILMLSVIYIYICIYQGTRLGGLGLSCCLQVGSVVSGFGVPGLLSHTWLPPGRRSA